MLNDENNIQSKPLTPTLLVTYTPMTYSDIDEWNTFHLPAIKESNRIDGQWNWKLYLTIANILNPLQQTLAYTLRVDNIIVGLTILANNYACKNYADAKTFVWYVSKSPAYPLVLKKYGYSSIKYPLMPYLLYPSFFHAAQKKQLTWLHSDPKGGNRLKEYYKNKMGFLSCPTAPKRVTRGFIRTHDEHYLYR